MQLICSSSSLTGDHHAFAPVFDVFDHLSAWRCSMVAAAEFPRFQAQEIDPHAGDICYAVTVADVNGDQKLDVVAVDRGCRRLVREPELAQARHHPQGDGPRQRLHPAARHRRRRPDRLRAGSRLASARYQEPQHAPVARPRRDRAAGRSTRFSFEEPTLHRLRWGDVKGTGKKQLVVAPLQGRGTKGPNWGAGEGVRVLVYDVPEKPDEPSTGRWKSPTRRCIQSTTFNSSTWTATIATRSWSRAGRACSCSTATHRDDGPRHDSARATRSPSRSKGRARSRSAGCAAAHPMSPRSSPGMVIRSSFTRPTTPRRRRRRSTTGPLWSRQVIAEPLQWGHAVWCANLDDDDDDELIIGQRDPNKPGTAGPRGPGVFVFDPKPGSNPLAFDRHTIDDGGMACEDALAADLDGDGRAGHRRRRPGHA